VIKYTEYHRDKASDGHFGPPVNETLISDWKKVRDLGKNKYPFHRLFSKLSNQKQR